MVLEEHSEDKQFKEDKQSTYSGHEITTLVDSSELLGHLLTNPIHTLLLTTELQIILVMREVDATQITLPIQTEEILVQQMVLQELAAFQ
jgi:hypothetical protein